jgi:hypothetical protein
MSPATPPATSGPAASPAAAPVSGRAAAALVGAFFLPVLAAWAWFHVGVRPPADAVRLDPRTEIPGWQFTAEPVPPKAQELLATTNLLNGVFHQEGGGRVTVFAADWHASDARQLSVVQHTPDICWVSIGWVPRDLGQPQRVSLMIAGQPWPFECRVFGVPGHPDQQLVLWSTLVSGQPIEEGSRWSSENEITGPRDRFRSARRMAGGQFISGLRERRAATGDKQFVRFSTAVSSDWQASLSELERFANGWLEVKPMMTSPEPARTGAGHLAEAFPSAAHPLHGPLF